GTSIFSWFTGRPSGAALARTRRGGVLAARLIILLCLLDLGFICRGAIAQVVMGQYQSRIAMDPIMRAAMQENTKAQKPGLEFKECANGCPLMIIVAAGKFIMGSPQNETDRDPSEGPQHETQLVRAAVRVRRNANVQFGGQNVKSLIHFSLTF